MSHHFDTIVIGVGGIGSATCYELAKRGLKVLGLEQFDIPHDKGSSHGHTRIIRMAYFESPSYIPLLRRAYELWDEIEDATGTKLLIKTGSLDIGEEQSEVFSGSLASCRVHHLPHEVLTGDQVNRRFPGYNIPSHFKANYSPDGGFLEPEKSIMTFVNGAIQKNAVIRAREKLVNWKSEGNSVIVKTEKDTYHANSLVFTSGAWSSHHLPFLKKLAVPERQVLAWLQPIEPQLFEPNKFPVFIMDFQDECYYGFPVHGIPGFKIGKFRHFYENCDPDTMNRKPNEKDENVLRNFSEKYFPKGSGPTMTLKTCMFTNTPDSHFIIDRHPDHNNVIFAAGFSGHGFKFASVMGEVMAELTIGSSSHNIDMFKLERFSV